MANPRSYQQILGGMISRFTARLGISRLKPGSSLLTWLEAAAQSDARSSQDIFKISQIDDLDNQEGQGLDRIGVAEDVIRYDKKKATALVSITDPTFQKISTFIYQGKGAPIVGSLVVYVSKGSTFDLAPSTGSIYLGRGTINYEGPIEYVSKSDAGVNWTLNLASPTTKFHNTGESVILAQGGSRPISSGQVVSTAQGAMTAPKTYIITQSVTLPDGETEITGVPIIATSEGEGYNVPRGSIVSFSGSPSFSGAVVTNPNPITSGRNVEGDNSYRDRIRQARNTRQRGSDTAIKNAIVNLSSTEENSSVLSSSLVRRLNAPSILYIDDGNGYEAKYRGVGHEVLIEQASGGETMFQTVYSPIHPACIESTMAAPFSLEDGMPLTLLVGGVPYTHYFDTNLFTVPTSASAYDLVSSINSNYTLGFIAKATSGGTKVSLFPKEDVEDTIEIVSDPTDANRVLGFPSGSMSSIALYKNDALLSKDGELAQVKSLPYETWWNKVLPTNNEYIIIKFIKSTADAYYFTQDDFIEAGHSTASPPSLETWRNVINNKLLQITATIQNDRLVLSSKEGRKSSAYISIVGGSVIDLGMFLIQESQGKDKEYTIDRATGDIVLTSPLSSGDRLTLGTNSSEAFVQSSKLVNYDTISSSDDVSYWVSVDDTKSIDFARSGIINITSAVSVPLTSVSNPITSTSDRAGAFASCIKSQIQDVSVAGIKKGNFILFNDPAFKTIVNGDWYQKAAKTNIDGGILIERRSGGTCRIGHTATVISSLGVDNLVLVVGGLTSVESGIGLPGAIKGKCATNSVEIFNPNNGTWVFTEPMSSYRAYHTATLLPSGDVFVCGGFNQVGVPLATTEIYNTSTKTWSTGPNMAQPRAHHTATLLPNSNALIVGGCNVTTLGANALNTAIEYDYASNTLVNPTTFTMGRYGHQAVLSGANVFILGGIHQIQTTASLSGSVERYSSGTGLWDSRASMSTARAFFGAARTGSSIIVVGNTRRFGFTNATESSITTNPGQNTYQVYNPTSNSWGTVKTLNNVTTFESTGLAVWNQGDIIISNTSARVIAGFAGYRFDVNTINRTSHLSYDSVGDKWDPISQTEYQLSSNLSGREGHVGVAFNSGSLSDTVAWIGGAVTSSTAYDTDITVDLLSYKDTEGLAVVPVETFNATTNEFNVPAVDFTALVLDEGRIVVADTLSPPQKITIPSESNKDYTAFTYAEAINANQKDVLAETYHTNSVRISTLSADGSLMAIDRDQDTLPLTHKGINLPSQPSQFATVKTQNACTDTPCDMQIWSVTKSGDHTSQVLSLAPGVSRFGHYQSEVDPSGTIVCMSHYPTGKVGEFIQNLGNSQLQISAIGSTYKHGSFINPEVDPVFNSIPTNYGFEIEARTNLDLIPRNPIYIGQSYKFTPTDSLVVTIDRDTSTQRFISPMARKMVPATGTYQNPLSLKDADNGNTTIATAFGLDYSFDDFAILSKAKAITDASDSTKRVVWRYSRFGSEGNRSCIRYIYPDKPDQEIKVRQTSVQSPEVSGGGYYYNGVLQSTIDVTLSSGGIRENRDMSPNTRVQGVKTIPSSDVSVWDCYLIAGYNVIEAERVSANGTTRLRVQIPDASIFDAGIAVGTILWFEANTPSSTTLQSGQFKVHSLGTLSSGVFREIYVAPLVLNDGTIMPNTLTPGTVSFDSTQEAKFDSSVAVNDLVVFDSINYFPGQRANRVVSIGASRQYIKCRHGNAEKGGTPDTQPSTIAVIGSDKMDIFEGSSSTAAQISAAVNSQENSPVSSVSTGSGVINVASWDQSSSFSSRTAFSDGVNHVKLTNKPANVSIDTTFDLKLPVTSALGVNGDYSNEVFYITPVSPKTVVQWLNTPAITGLWTVADITTCDRGSNVQIKTRTPGITGSILVEGGGANLATASVKGTPTRSNYNTTEIVVGPFVDRKVPVAALVVTTTTGEAQAFTGDSLVEMSNSQNTEKVGNGTSTWGAYNNLIEISKDGTFTFTASVQYEFPAPKVTSSSTIVKVEKIGKYVAINIPTEINSYERASYDVKSGDFISLTPYLSDTVSPGNQGVFRIIYTSSNETYQTFWIKNEYATEELKACTLKLLRGDSIIPKDNIIIDSPDFGEKNRGEWKVVEVIDNVVKVDTSKRKPVAWFGSINPTVESVTVISGTPVLAIKRLVSIAPNENNPDWSDMLLLDEPSTLDTSHEGYIMPWSETAGTVIRSLGKLEFPQSIAVGSDAYRYNYGLIAEAKRVIYGDKADPSNYDGYVSNGASVLIQGPTIKRTKVSLSIRLSGNVAGIDTETAIKSAVASAINSSSVGRSIPISDIVNAAAMVGGVKAVSVIYPNYSPSNDLIEVNGDEKPIVVDVDRDISIVFTE